MAGKRKAKAEEKAVGAINRQKIVDDTFSSLGFGYAPEGPELSEMVSQGLVKVDPNTRHPETGHIAVAATQELVDSLQPNRQNDNSNTTSEEKSEETQVMATATVTPSKFTVRKSSEVPMPEIKRRSNPERYPWGQLEVGDSFHVPGKTVKQMEGVVIGAVHRYAVPDPSGATKVNRKGETVPVMQKVRDFRSFAADANDPDGPGVRVFRTL